MIRKYELMFVLQPDFTEDEVVVEAKKITDILVKYGAEITQTVDLGKKKLAYPIKKHRYAYYQLVDFSAEGSSIQLINNALRLEPQVLRHMALEKPEKTPEQIEKEQAMKARLAARRQLAEAGETAKISAEAVLDENITPEELDKQLNKILDETPNS